MKTRLDFFGGMPPKNLYKDSSALESIERHVKVMTKFNVWIDAVLERQGQYFFIRDTKIVH